MTPLTRASLVSAIVAGSLPLTDWRPDAAQDPAPPAIRIVHPEHGTVHVSNKNAQVEAELAPAFRDPDNFDFVQIVVTSADGTRQFHIRTGDLRLLDAMDHAGTTWRTDPLPSGDYVITASLQDRNGHLFSDQVQVTLNRAPGAVVHAATIEEVSGGADVTLQAIVQDIENDPIDRVRWTPGDGSDPVELADLTPFTHTYASVPGQVATYIATFTVDDARGGSTTVQRDVILDATGESLAVSVAQTHDCGCNDMHIFSRANLETFTYCRDGRRPPNRFGCQMVVEPGACKKEQTAYRCPLGPYSPGERGADLLGWSFEVNATLHPDTNNLGNCTEGQVAQRTWTFNGMTKPNQLAHNQPGARNGLPFPAPRPAGGIVNGRNNLRYPQVGGANWGADLYDRPSDYKLHLAAIDTIRWWDSPSIGRDTGNALTDRLQFVAWVTGALGTCWCQFEIDQSWTAAGGRVGPAVVTRIAGVNCTID